MSEYLPQKLVSKSKSQLLYFFNKNAFDFLENEEIIKQIIDEVNTIRIYLDEVHKYLLYNYRNILIEEIDKDLFLISREFFYKFRG